MPDANDPGNRKVFMTAAEAEYMATILREQPYIRNLTISDHDYIPAADVNVYVDLNLFRQRSSAFAGREIREWLFYSLSSMRPENLDKAWITVPASAIKPLDKVLICFTERYKPATSPMCLEPFKDNLLYIGLPKEHKRFCEQYFEVGFQPVQSAKEALQIASKSRGFVGNISGQFAYMESAAIPRVLCLPVGGGDVRCRTPNGTAAMDSSKLIKSVETLFERPLTE